MNIQELESKCGVTKQNIRFYERKGLLHPNRNLENNYREYDMEDVERLQSIKMMRKIDVSIEDIREVLEKRLPMEDLIKKNWMPESKSAKNCFIHSLRSWIHQQFLRKWTKWKRREENL